MKATDLLRADHEKIRTLFKQAERADNDHNRRDVFLLIKRELNEHSKLEETLFYPLFQNEEDFRDLIATSLDDHREIADLLNEIAMEETIEIFDSSLDEMIQAVEDHLNVEEAELFPMVEERLSPEQLNMLGHQLLRQKNSEYGLRAA